MAHTAKFFLVDQDRKIRAMYDMASKVDEVDDVQVVKDIEKLL